MEHRLLGHGALRVSAIGLGCMSMSGTYGKSDDADSIAVIHRALDLGVNFLDSSDMYGWGHNEELLGRAARGPPPRRRPRHQVRPGAEPRRRRQPGGRQRRPTSGSACEASLKRLGVDDDRPLLPAPGGSQGPDRGDGGRDGASPRGGQDPGARALRDGARHDPPGARRPSDRRAADGVLAPLPAARGGRARDVPGARHRLRRVLAARPQPADRPGPSVPTTFPRTTGRRQHPRFQGDEPRPQCAAGEAARGDRAREGRAPRPSSPSRGSWPGARTSSRSPAPSGSTDSRRTSARSRSGWTPPTSAGSTKRCPRAPARAPGTRSPR